MSAAVTPPPRWERRKQARPQELLAAALALFGEHGYAATCLDDVARRAGVSKGTLYRYFETKEALFQAVVRQHVVNIVDQSEDDSASVDVPSLELMRMTVSAWWARIGGAEAAVIARLIVAESSRFPDLALLYSEQVVARGTAMIAVLIERGIARGEFRPVAPTLLAPLLLAPALSLTQWVRPDGLGDGTTSDPRAMLDLLIDITTHGVLARPPAAAWTAQGPPAKTGDDGLKTSPGGQPIQARSTSATST